MKKKLLSLMVALLAITAFAATMSVTMTKRAPVTELTVISEATTWDFSKLTANTSSDYYASEGIKLTDESTPTKNDEFIYANYLTTFFTADASFKADAIAFKGEYPIRKNKYSQNGILHFKTSVAGKIVVSFNDTGSTASATAVKRYLVVNDTQTEYWTSRENNGESPYAAQLNVTSGEIEVPAGDVTITGSSAIQVSKIVFTPDAGGSGDDPFKTKVDAALAAPVAGVATLTLDADYTVKSAINVPLGTQLVIDGAGHTLTLGAETNFVINDNITLKDVKIDATALTSPLMALTATPAEGTKKNQEVYTDAAATDFNLLNAVTVENVMVKNLKTQFISSNGADWALENFTLTKSIIQLDATGKNFIAFDATANNKGAIKNITISENTIYNINETSNAYFLRFANQSNAAKAFGTNNGTSTFDWKLQKNTFVNSFKAQKFWNNTPNNGKVTAVLTQNVFYEINQIKTSQTGQWALTATDNVIWGSATQSSDVNTIAAKSDPGFVAPTTALDLAAENGGIDLHVGASTLAAKNEAGDPRWKTAYVKAGFSALVAEALAGAVDGKATLTLIDDYDVDAAVAVPLGTQLTIDGANHTLTLGEATNFVLNDNITLKNVKIDATALTSPLMALTATPAEGTKKNQEVYTDAAATDFNLLNAVTVENVMVKNLKTQFISSNGADWALENFTLTKSIIQLDATGKNFIAFDATANNKGAIKNITISENTIYNINETSNAYFLRFANQSNAAKAFGTNNGTSTFDWKLQKNTFVNSFKAQKFWNNTPNNGKVTAVLTQNVFYEINQIKTSQTGQWALTATDNVIWGSATQSSDVNTIAAKSDPGFVAPTTALDLAAENGGIDLHVGASTLAAKNEAGDPRWKVTFVGYDVKVVNAEGITITPEVTKAAEGEKVYCTYVLAEDYKLERPDFVDDDNNPIEFVDGTTCGLEEVGGVEKMWIIMPAKNVTIKAKVTAMPKFYIIGDMNGWDRTAMTKMTYNDESGRYEYDYAPTTTAYFAFADYQQTAAEAEADAIWETFNSTYRYSLGAGNVDATIGEIKSLTKGVDGTIVLQPGTYKISVEKDFNAVTITGEVAPPPTEDTYVVAGAPASLFGTEWSGTAEANKMTKNTETGLYELKFTGVAFTAATTIEYKIVKNGSTWIPEGMGNNQTVAIEAAGTYDIIFTFNPETNAITGVATIATGIYGISVDGVSGDIFSDGKPVYNLSGQRVFKGYKGIVIKNGRKIVVK